MSEPRRNSVRYGSVNMEYISRMASWPEAEDGPVFMVNLMKYRPVADYGDAAAGGKSGREADDEYTPSEILREIGAQIVFAAEVEQQLIGEPRWDRIGIVRYATRRSFLDMQRRRDFQEKHVHKDAGMEQTIVMGGLPQRVPALPPVEASGDPDDPPFVMMHVLKHAPGGAELLAEYETTVRPAALELGIRPDVVLKVEGTVVGDGRDWSEVRFNRFPSHSAFRELASRPLHQNAQPLRLKALEYSYSIMLRPSIDRLARTAYGQQA